MEKHYWKANPHPWGPGQTHIIHEDGTKTLCGQQLSECPGRRIPAIEYTCRACAKSLEVQERQAKAEREWQERQRERERQREVEDRAWWKWYNAYLQSSKWQGKRAEVFKRARGLCEACGRRRATEVHHTTYAHVGDEPLFDLHAICEECHVRITKQDRENRTFRSFNYPGMRNI